MVAEPQKHHNIKRIYLIEFLTPSLEKAQGAAAENINLYCRNREKVDEYVY